MWLKVTVTPKSLVTKVINWLGIVGDSMEVRNFKDYIRHLSFLVCLVEATSDEMQELDN